MALDESPRSTAALTAAAALAAELDAELAGLFVEDIDLQHLIGLPFAREFSVLTGAGRPLSQTEMEQSWRREAETMQRLLAEAARRLRLRWSFRVARGRVTAEVNLLAQAFDLIVLGKRTGLSVMAVARPVAGIHPHAGPVLVLFDDREAVSRSLDMGARLARHNGAELVLLDQRRERGRVRCGLRGCAGHAEAARNGGALCLAERDQRRQPDPGGSPRTGELPGAGQQGTLPDAGGL